MQLRPLKQNGALQPRRKQPALQTKRSGKEVPRNFGEGRGYRIPREQPLGSVGLGCRTAREDQPGSHAAPTRPVPAEPRAAQQGVSPCSWLPLRWGWRGSPLPGHPETARLLLPSSGFVSGCWL